MISNDEAKTVAKAALTAVGVNFNDLDSVTRAAVLSDTYAALNEIDWEIPYAF